MPFNLFKRYKLFQTTAEDASHPPNTLTNSRTHAYIVDTGHYDTVICPVCLTWSAYFPVHFDIFISFISFSSEMILLIVVTDVTVFLDGISLFDKTTAPPFVQAVVSFELPVQAFFVKAAKVVKEKSAETHRNYDFPKGMIFTVHQHIVTFIFCSPSIISVRRQQLSFSSSFLLGIFLRRCGSGRQFLLGLVRGGL